MSLIPGMAETAALRRSRGRGATPRVEKQITLERPNRFGRRTLRFRYRPLKHWTREEIDLAERGLTYYFKRVGGLALIDDALMRLFIDRLRSLAEEARQLHTRPAMLIRWAIDAKAASLEGRTPEEARDKRRFVGRADNFFARDLDRWLDLSVDRARWSARLAERARAERARELSDRMDRERRDRLAAAEARRLEAERRRRGELTGEELRLLAAWQRSARNDRVPRTHRVRPARSWR